MNYNWVHQLLDNGLSPEEIVNQVKKASPMLSKKVMGYLFGGYGVHEILQNLLNDKEVQNTKFTGKPSTPDEIANLISLQSKMKVPTGRDEIAKQQLKNFAKGALIAGGAVAPFVAPEIGAALGVGSQMGESVEGGEQQPPVEAAVTQPEQAQEPRSIFQQLTRGVDIKSLSESRQEQFGFLEIIANQLESQGKAINDPEFKRIAKKIKKLLAGKKSIIEQETERFGKEYSPVETQIQQPQVQPQQPQVQPQQPQQPQISQPQQPQVQQQQGPSAAEQNLSQMMQKGISLLDQLRKSKGM